MLKKFLATASLFKEKSFSFILPRYKFLFPAVLFFAILLPFVYADAIFEGLAEQIANAIFSTIFKLILGAVNMVVQASLFILNWVLSDDFIPWAYTSTSADCSGNKACNPIINIGWTLTRDLANMSFIIVLVAIGLGTALKLGEYQVQKTLPTLIVIALLINFTPVLLGLMVDAANITMNFFLQSVSGLDAWGRITESQVSVLMQTLQRQGAILGMISAIFQVIMLVIIDLLSAAIILAFAGLFAVRYIAIWLLVILSPIVFASRVLPMTKNMYWNKWWNEFVQWTIIGIPAAFFLYLGNHIMILAPQMGLQPPAGSDNAFTSFFAAIMPFGIALIFLWFGFFVTLTSSATGSSGIIKTVQKGVKKIPNTRRAQQVKGKAAGAASATLGGAAGAATRIDQFAGQRMGLLGRGLQIATKPTAWALRSADKAAMPGLVGAAAAARSTPIPKQWEQMSAKEKERFVSYQGLSQDRVNLAAKMIADKTFKDTSKAFQEKIISDAQKQAGNVHLKKQIEDIINFAPDKITKKMMIDFELAGLSGDAKKKKQDDIQKQINELIGKEGLQDDAVRIMTERGKAVSFTTDPATGRTTPVITKEMQEIMEAQAVQILKMQKLSPGDIEKISKDSLNTDAFRIASQSMTQSHFQKLLDTHGKDVIDKVMNGNHGVNTIINSKDDLENFYLKNPNLVNFFAKSPAGQALDWSGLTYASSDAQYKDLQNKMKVLRRLNDKGDRDLVLAYSRTLDTEREAEAVINRLGPGHAGLPAAAAAGQRASDARRSAEAQVAAAATNNPEIQKVVDAIRNLNPEALRPTPPPTPGPAPGPAPRRRPPRPTPPPPPGPTPPGGTP